jgi:hypothetical protein
LKHGRNPTVKQCEIIKNHGLDYREWLIVKHTSTEMIIIHRETKEQKSIKKEHF